MPARKSQTSDITTYARIRNAALKLFGEHGTSATSIRTVAKAAGVSPGLVQHHFKTKAELQAALETYVLGKVADLAATSLTQSAHPTEFIIGRQIMAFIRENPDVIRYARRVLLEDDALGRKLFDQIVFGCRMLMEQLAKDGILRNDLDMEWASLNAMLMVVGPVLFEPGINRHLAKPFRSDEGLARWDVACDDLWCRGFYSAKTQTLAKPVPSKAKRRILPPKKSRRGGSH